MKIYNAFGIQPSNNWISAGTDFYVPNIKLQRQEKLALLAFEKSYNKTTQEINQLLELFKTLAPSRYENNIVNMLHLFLALYDPNIEYIKKNESLAEAIIFFIKEYIVFDPTKNVVGIQLKLNDSLFINSGVKIALDTVLSEQVAPNPAESVKRLRSLGIGVAGLYVNKSGKGNAGWDVRACLVDEDYSGYVHLSQAYTKEVIDGDNKNIIYCGDKLTQMILIPVFHTNYEEIDEESYNNIMSNSNRGDNGFGSSDEKH